MRHMTRRNILKGSVAAVLSGLTASFAPAEPDAARLSALLPKVRLLQEALRKQMREWVGRGDRIARGDGFIYTIDVAQLMVCAADAKDRGVYDALHAQAIPRLVLNDPSEPYVKGFVPWRFKAGSAPDASGTTEALRLAKALWWGAGAFDRPADRELALLILDGYARHAAAEKGVWYVRNYFNLGTKAFATNSYLVDYDADFVDTVAREANSDVLADVAKRSYALVKKAATPCGLIHDLVQPELRTLYPDLDGIEYFSPNDVIQISNAAAVACTVTKGDATTARRVLDFALKNMPDLRLYFFGRTGEIVHEKSRAGVCEYSLLARLAAQCSDSNAAAAFAVNAVPTWEQLIAARGERINAYAATESLAAMAALVGMKG